MERIRRRGVTITGLAMAALVLVALAPLWLVLLTAGDLIRGRWRLPMVRLVAFATCWAWLELAGVSAAGALWLSGRGRNLAAHYALQRWWAKHLMASLRSTTAITVETSGVEAISPGPVVMFARHASLADSLVSAWVITVVAGMQPRYILKRELLFDPCLDVVGHRIPNYFLDRAATDSTQELEAITALGQGLGANGIAVIFSEGTRANPAKRAKALASIARTDEPRSRRMSQLQHLLPPRPAGSAALLDASPDADVVLAWHTGFDGLDTFGGVLRHLTHRPPPVRFQVRRIPRASVPMGAEFGEWLDDAWLDMDQRVHAMLSAS